MIEFGSDFNYVNILEDRCFPENSSTIDFRFYACGRQAIEALIFQEKWQRIWIPAYFCYEVISHIASTGIEVMFYDDNPLVDNDSSIKIISNLPLLSGDVILRVNFFGFRGFTSNYRIPVPVIEDHTHDLLSDWAKNSDADWCIASIRKSLPIAAGGILWSPKNKILPKQVKVSEECKKMALLRYEAMRNKTDYLEKGGDKKIFRDKFILSEKMIEQLAISGMDRESRTILDNMDINSWTENRKENWEHAVLLLNSKFNVVRPKSFNPWNPFSIILLCNTAEERTSFRTYLINNDVYPAILWSVPKNSIYRDAVDISERMLSIHCDARYTKSDIELLCKILNSYYD